VVAAIAQALGPTYALTAAVPAAADDVMQL
jgi:hypothetical protein